MPEKKPIHDLALSNPSIPAIARRLYSSAFGDAELPENCVRTQGNFVIDCSSGWIVGSDEHGNIVAGRLAVYERATNPTLPTQTALKAWPV